jgi:hypothetical protein
MHWKTLASAVILTLVASVAWSAPDDSLAAEEQNRFERYCSTCHSRAVPLRHCKNGRQRMDPIAKMSGLRVNFVGSAIPDKDQTAPAFFLARET